MKLKGLKDRLEDTDIIETIRQFETNRVGGQYLYRVCRTVDENYGANYLVQLGRECITNPQNTRFNFKANSVMLARYWFLFLGKLYKATGKKEYLDFIKGYLNDPNQRIMEEAQTRLNIFDNQANSF